ncbi:MULTISPECIES: DUF6978 family protein [unclassified Coleofasciculus]|uniref:DUF6978 family protein n=1 Tax=unclassified Coleofasciculus TaxID=2692782 RepID=UPI0018828B60|nr:MULTISPECIES: hypothetical protein [unclassified Coleofasciculus]MBE9126039.1 hypothetical protein [Coleofasciculus sp. LEGE 07081]MBE9148727.1 hypothetical protein [Coleofasciculus sp. LEGE 07092]
MLSQDEFEELITDTNKRIEGDIRWLDDEDHSPAVEFRVEVVSDAGYPIFIKGSYNELAQKLSYVIIHRAAGRIYGLDLGQDHRNPDGEQVGEKHKHRWDELYRDKKAYVPPDITAPITEPVTIWQQFCLESRITHNGIMQEPPPLQLDLFL